MFGKDNKQKAKALFGLGAEMHLASCCLAAVYDFTQKGGALGDIALVNDLGDPAILPQGAIIRRVLCYVVTAVTSAGAATVALKAVNAADLMVATAKTSLTAAALIDGVPVTTAATSIGPLAADTTVKITVATAALTAGKIIYYIDYVVV